MKEALKESAKIIAKLILFLIIIYCLFGCNTYRKSSTDYSMEDKLSASRIETNLTDSLSIYKVVWSDSMRCKEIIVSTYFSRCEDGCVYVSRIDSASKDIVFIREAEEQSQEQLTKTDTDTIIVARELREVKKEYKQKKSGCNYFRIGACVLMLVVIIMYWKKIVKVVLSIARALYI